MILTLKDKRVNKWKHNYGILIKDVNTGKFDVIEFTNNLPCNILAIAIVRITKPGLCRTHSMNQLKKLVQKMGAKQITKACNKMEYKLLCDPNRTTARKEKIVQAEPGEYSLPMKSELVHESKFGIKLYKVEYKDEDKGDILTRFYKGETVAKVRETFFEDKPDSIFVSAKALNNWVITKRNNSFRKIEDKGLSTTTFNSLQDAVKELSFFTGKQYTIISSSIENRYSIQEDGIEIIAANESRKLIAKLEGLQAIYQIENEDDFNVKNTKRIEENEKMMEEMGLI